MTNQPKWRKSTFSGTQGDCVELADLGSDLIGVRDSKDPDGPALQLNRAQVADLVDRVKAGELDDLT